MSLQRRHPMANAHGVLRSRIRPRHVVGFLAAAALAAPTHGFAQSPSRPIGLGEARTLRSAILNEDREVQVALPETYARTAIAYPVLFVLDGSSHLLHATATTRFLASARNRIPEMIVVAIPNTNRNRDLTPGPGAATFQRFLGEELIPWVERNYRAAPERILLGHSLGASFTVHTLLNRPELFDAYIAASAPVWRYDSLAADMRAGLARAARAGAALHLTVGEHENERLRDGVQRLAAALRAADPGTVPVWTYVDMTDEDHSSTPPRSLYHALEARYAEWRFPFFEDQAELDRAGGLRGLEEHYQRFSERFGYRAPPPEARLVQVARLYFAAERPDDVIQLAGAYAAQYPATAEGMVNQIGYDQLRRGQVAQAVQTFRSNAEAFPASPNVHDSLGDAYCRAGDAPSGRQSYQQAARAAETRSPPHPRVAWYQEKANRGCAAAP